MQQRDRILVVAGTLLVLVLALLIGGGVMGPGMMMGWGYGFGWLAMLFFWALLIGGLIVLGLWAFRHALPAGPAAGPGTGRALEILKERYARGEITREQYEQMRRELEV